jgi:glycosyltransferase involved in cell wall biosynthesis
MKKVLVITITYNRLDLTKQYLGELREKADYPFEHIIVDNGSTDGTVEWLRENCYNVIRNEDNEGIVSAWIKGVRMARLQGFEPDYIVKFDNDCQIVTEGILGQIMKFYEEAGGGYCITAPIDLEIAEDYKPGIVDDRAKWGDFNVMITSHTGGMLTAMSIEAFDDMAKENGGRGVEKDCDRGWFWRSNGYQCVYLKDLGIRHKGESTSYNKYKF